MLDFVNIRPMKPEDTEKVAQIDAECIDHPWTKQDFEDTFKYLENVYYVAEVTGEIVGFVGLMKFVDDGDITHIAVLPDFRRCGVGEALLNRLFEYATENSIKAVHLEVREHNDVARNLYRKMGFEYVSTRKNYYDAPVEDALVLVKKLS